jgi:signal transduction histidine kinase
VDYDDFLCAIVPEDRERVDKIIKSSQRTGEPYTITYKIMRRDGEYRILLSKGEAIKDASGRVVRMFSINQDVTEMKQAEREANEARMQAELYLDLMGHDIRNMNQVGMGYLELALDSPDINRNDKELLLKSMGALKNSTRLIENVRKMQKALIGEFKLHETDACQTIQRVISHYSNMPGVKATLNNDLPLACPVMANDLLYEVFENLVGNAIKHAGPEPTITIKFGTTLFNGKDYYRFIVEDNGPGIPDDRKEKIFNRLHKGSARGMGLGLYLVKSLVESYHGKVWVEDRVQGDYSKGARFVVLLPAIRD